MTYLTITACSFTDMVEFTDKEMFGSVRLDEDWFIFHSALYKDNEQVGDAPRTAVPMGTIKTYFLDTVNRTLSLETDTGVIIQGGWKNDDGKT